MIKKILVSLMLGAFLLAVPSVPNAEARKHNACNPCGMKNACNPCAMKKMKHKKKHKMKNACNPCAMKKMKHKKKHKMKNACNPCGKH